MDDSDEPRNFVGVVTPRWICVGVVDRAEFDKISRPASDHGLRPHGHVLTKSVEQRGVIVVFQHWLSYRSPSERHEATQSEQST
jgi:hypothetical protein